MLVCVDSDVVVHADAPEAPGAVSGFRKMLRHHVHAEAAGDADTFWAGLGALRREAFAAIGGFDERYEHASVEDMAGRPGLPRPPRTRPFEART